MAASILDLPRPRRRDDLRRVPLLHVVVGRSAGDAAAVASAVLAHGGGVIALDRVIGLGKALERLAAEPAALVLLQAPDPDVARVALGEVKRAHPALPVVLVTDGEDDDAAVAAVRAGAEDCLSAAAATGPKVVRAIRCALERTSHAAALRTQAVTDALTGLPNRHALQTALEHAVARARRTSRTVAVLFVDLDGFKGVNDLHGHAQGDRVLQEMARRLVARTRDMDTVARLGGDEFVVVMEDLDNGRRATTLATKLLAALAEPVVIDGQTSELSASIGISVCPDDGVDAAALVRHADAAMYAAKQAGKHQYRYYQARMNEHARERAVLDAALARAFDGGEFEVHVQPVWAASAKRITACEALVRWRRPGHGLQLPSDFLEAVEDAGLGLRLADWVIGAACDLAARMRQAGVAVPMSVNLSRRQLMHGDIVERLTIHLSRTMLPAEALQVEVGEGLLAGDDPRLDRTLAALSGLGIPIVVDDFGSGGASLRALRRVRPAAVKVDGTLVRELPESREAVALVRAVVALARTLDIHVVAEGVETEAQSRSLRALGCHALQGYFYGHALPAEEWLAYQRWACTAIIGSDGPPVTSGARRRRSRRDPDAVPRLPGPALPPDLSGRVVVGRFRS